MTEQFSDEVLEIIRATHDGDDLSDFHLRLTEWAMNAFLNEKGKQAFRELLANVRQGYKPE